MKLVKDLGCFYPRETSKVKKRYGIYECPNCRKHFRTSTPDVLNGKSTQCRDCLFTHKKRNHPLYQTWNGMMTRCYNSKSPAYRYYGARGVIVCEEFKDINKWISYVESLPDYDKRISEAYTQDRIIGSKGYERDNIRWASKSTQSHNQNHFCGRYSKKTGVSFQKRIGKFCAYMTHKKVSYHLGFYTKEEDAIAARVAKEQELIKQGEII